MQLLSCFLTLLVLQACSAEDSSDTHHHHHHGKHHHGKHHKEAAKVAVATAAVAKVTTVAAKTVDDEKIVASMKALEARLAVRSTKTEGHLFVNGPLPADFSERFSQAVAQATGSDAVKVKVSKTTASKDQRGVFDVDFKADPMVIKAVESQSADPKSKLANGNLHSFLVADSDEADVQTKATRQAPVPLPEKGLDIDTAMPYGELEPFGREDTAQELTESSVTESNTMVDQLERAEVAEEKRSVFRALTRLRGAAITSFDGVARSQTGNIDEYNKIHQWRQTHPLHHLADEESDVAKWAFPDNADF